MQADSTPSGWPKLWRTLFLCLLLGGLQVALVERAFAQDAASQWGPLLLLVPCYFLITALAACLASRHSRADGEAGKNAGCLVGGLGWLLFVITLTLLQWVTLLLTPDQCCPVQPTGAILFGIFEGSLALFPTVVGTWFGDVVGRYLVFR